VIDRENQEELIFEQAAQIAGDAERAAYLDQVCRGDPELRGRLEVLLEGHFKGQGFLDRAPVRAAERGGTVGVSAPDEEEIGTVIGRYRLLEKVGEGGFGVVYVAEQCEPVKRRVALKIIKLGMDTRQVVARFEAERQALALMDHPNIARIFDAGITGQRPVDKDQRSEGGAPDFLTSDLRPLTSASGRPYFVMEVVRGMRITDYCDQNNLSTEQRLGLFMQVCHAIQHAHQKGIIHRDIKPSNILVTVVDGRPVPKVIDFGIAKATQGQLTDKTVYTQLHQLIGTPAYMSPEQAVLSGVDVDTRSDIYSLGVLLYELLTGHTPFDPETLVEAGLDEMRRMIREQEPSRPSTLISTLDEAERTTVAKHRQVEPASLRHLVRGDLDWIVMKCLEKDRGRRYETAHNLALDVEHHLRHEPVSAVAPSTLYRAHKFVRRHRTGLATAGALVLLLLAGVVVSTWQAMRATRAEKDLRERLWASHLAEARANRWSGRAGRRFDSLNAIRQAAAVRPTLELRNEAIACLALPDVRVQSSLELDGQAKVIGFAVDANFERYACAYEDSSISVCRLSDHFQLLKLPARATMKAGGGLLFSPLGRFLAFRPWREEKAGESFGIWDTSNGRLVLSVPYRVRGVNFSPDDRQAALAEAEGTVRLYDLPGGNEVGNITLAPPVNYVAFDPAGKRLAVSRTRKPSAIIVDLQTRAICASFTNAQSVQCIGWSPDGTLLACPSDDERLYLWDVAAGQSKALEGHSGAVTGALFNRLGDMLVSYGWDGVTWFWNPKLGLPLVSLPGGYEQNGFDPSDRRLAFGLPRQFGIGAVGIWEVDPAAECRQLGRTAPLWGGAFTADSRVLATASSDGVRLWQVQANHLVAHLPIREARSVIWHPNRTNLIVSGWSGAELWPVEVNSEDTAIRIGSVQQLSSSSRERAALTPDGRFLVVTGVTNSDLLVLDLGEFNQPKLLTGHSQASFASISPDGNWLATGTWQGTAVKVWSLPSCQPIKELPVKGSAQCLFSPDGRWLLTGSAEEYCSWQVNTWEAGLKVARDGTSSMPGSMAISPDGRMAAILHGRNRGVKLISMPSGQELASLDTGEPLCFSPDGSQLATSGGDRQTLTVWDLGRIRSALRALKLDWD
jgi:serine/threonine protein kinase/WD40 repeat protein